MRFRLRLVGVVILMVSPVAWAQAEPGVTAEGRSSSPAPPPQRGSGAGQGGIIGDPVRDARQTMQARQLMLDDPELARINIGVIVTDRVAVLWGPVPSAEVAFKAELCVRTMIELVEVRSELFVSELLQPIRAPLKIDIPPLFLPEHLPPKLPVERRPILGAPGLLTGQDKAEAKTGEREKGRTGEGESQKYATKSLSPFRPSSASALRGNTPALPTLGLPQADQSAEVVVEPPGLAEADRELAAAIRKFLQNKTTYSSVQFAVKDRRVYLKAAAEDSDALHEAARGIARLPNVEGVILPDRPPR
jgi:hypothetical protein